MRARCGQAGSLLWRGLCLPYRLYRGRISVQLIVSYLAVVLLTMVALYAAVIAALLGYLPSFVLVGGAELTVDYTIGEKARTVAVLLGGNPSAADPDLADPETLAAVLRRVVDRGTVGTLNDTGATEPAGLGLDRVDYALVAAPDGTIVAASDGGWAPAGRPVSDVALSLVGQVTNQAIALDGAMTLFDEAYTIEDQDRITVASYPILARDQLLGVVTLQSEPLDFSTVPIRNQLVREIATEFVRDLPAMAVPALLISIPVGVWRARRVSRRLSRVAAAADAMACGDLDQRVEAVGEDEVGRLAERFNFMVEHLGGADRARKTFVANVSHELRTPVAIIQGHAERLLAARAREPVAVGPSDRLGEPRSDDDAAALAAVYRETLTLSRLIDDLFTLARLDEAMLPVEPTPVRLDRVAEEAVAGLRALAWGERKVTIRSLVRPEVPTVLADPTRVRQILNNLLHNALRHTPEGGVIVVDAGSASEGGAVEVSVADSGVGIAATKLPAIFDRYAHGDDVRPRDGTGLGLHIVHQLVEAQGGTIWVESEPGCGSTFRFTLPRAR